MCKPRTKIEREVDRLHRQLPPINKRQTRWAVQLASPDAVFRFRGKKMCIRHFIIATTKSDWQVLRHFYLYAHYRYGKLAGTEIVEVMQQWYRQGDYVFYSRNRVQGYCNDAWAFDTPMSIKRGRMGGYVLTDPRELDYYAVRYERTTTQFRDLDLDGRNVTDVFLDVNTDPIWETILRQNPKEYDTCRRLGLTTDKRKTSAVRIARRHRYNYCRPEWRDLLDNLLALGKDYRNPRFICPADLHAAHDELARQIETRRRREAEARERMWAQQREELRLEKLKQDEEARENFVRLRSRFFGLIIQGKGIEIRCLKSVEEFAEEGEAMHHCVFGNAYYDTSKHPDSLILSARKDGQRMETIEVSLRDYSIVQARGKYNQDSPCHADIMSLVNDHMSDIRRLAV